MPRKPRPKELPRVVTRLTRMRQWSGLTQKELAEKLGYSYFAVHGWENGTIHPSYQSLVDWCGYFDLELDAREVAR